MKKLICLAVCLLLLFSFPVIAFAAQTVDYSLEIPAAVTLKKSVTAAIRVSASERENLGAMIFTIRYDPDVLTYKEVAVGGEAGGEVRANAQNGVLKIVYLSTDGQALNGNAKELISLRFTALTTQCTSSLILTGKQAVSSQEKRLPAQDPVEYRVTLQAKETNDTTPAKGKRLKTSSASGSKNQTGNKVSSARASAVTGKSDDYADPFTAEDGEYGSPNTMKVGPADNDNLLGSGGFLIFLCVTGGVILLAGVVFAAYKMGTKKREEQHENDKEQNNPKETTNSPAPENEQAVKDNGKEK